MLVTFKLYTFEGRFLFAVYISRCNIMGQVCGNCTFKLEGSVWWWDVQVHL